MKIQKNGDIVYLYTKKPMSIHEAMNILLSYAQIKGEFCQEVLSECERIFRELK